MLENKNSEQNIQPTADQETDQVELTEDTVSPEITEEADSSESMQDAQSEESLPQETQDPPFFYQTKQDHRTIYISRRTRKSYQIVINHNHINVSSAFLLSSISLRWRLSIVGSFFASASVSLSEKMLPRFLKSLVTAVADTPFRDS